MLLCSHYDCTLSGPYYIYVNCVCNHSSISNAFTKPKFRWMNDSHPILRCTRSLCNWVFFVLVCWGVGKLQILWRRILANGPQLRFSRTVSIVIAQFLFVEDSIQFIWLNWTACKRIRKKCESKKSWNSSYRPFDTEQFSAVRNHRGHGCWITQSNGEPFKNHNKTEQYERSKKEKPENHCIYCEFSLSLCLWCLM